MSYVNERWYIIHTLGNETSSAIDTSRVELNEFKVLEWEASTSDHSITVTRASVRTRAAEVGTAITTSGQNSLVRSEAVQSTVLHVECNDTDTFTTFHDQVQCEVLDEEIGVVSERLAVKSVEKRVTCAVGGGSTPVSLSTLPIMKRLTAEGTLVDFPFLRSREGDTEVLKLNYGAGSFTTHVMNGVLVTEPVRALDLLDTMRHEPLNISRHTHRIIHVPSPIILRHITKSRIDTALSSDSMATSREQLRNASSLEACLCKTKSSTQAGTTGTTIPSTQIQSAHPVTRTQGMTYTTSASYWCSISG
jgi:hypothetical protein